ncbi:MAG: helix-turn-helix transcriptional regulator [Desulfobacter sp.]|nr:MAG: helix-turn-helix transcriptional regulator [Desulfobacter sp.]
MGIVYKSGPVPKMEVLLCTDDFEFRPHIHDRYVVWINTGGGEHYTAKGSTDILGKGNISVFEPGLVHSNHPASGSRRCLRSFYLDPEFFHELGRKAGASPRANYFTRYTFKDPESWSKLARLHGRMLTGPADLSLDTDILDIFSELLARHAGQNRGAETDGCDKRVQMAIDYFHAHPDTDIRLQELAELAGCTEFHLIRLFRQHTGLSPHALLVQIRLEHARHRIEKGDSIAMAAFSSGFSDQSHLTRRFKLRYGLTPKKYQACRMK